MGGDNCMTKLTEKQKRFADYYIETGNATQAAVKAGYSKKYANTNANKLLQNTTIKNYIDKKLEEMSSQRIASANEVMELLTSAARGELEEEVVVVENIGDYCSEAKVIKKQIGAKDRLKAAELLGKRYRLWTDKMEVKGMVPVMIVGEDELED